MFFDFNLHIDVISYKNNESILFPQNSYGKNKFKNIWLFLHGDGEKQLIEMLLKTRIIISCCFISLLAFFEEDCYASRPGSKECVKVSSASFTVRGGSSIPMVNHLSERQSERKAERMEQ